MDIPSNMVMPTVRINFETRLLRRFLINFNIASPFKRINEIFIV